ncbi:hypothetical protein J2TS6_02980 [Paenibacillus albilobatus]|uniref:Uncharacterized protein n=1 Tax=Paenibacillus albilobatus TaxID=2716884 RepID=A0A920CA62_9BACL|nr:hypothetical protein J2TS6_02980 [Paenibacillus albilobatus]
MNNITLSNTISPGNNFQSEVIPLKRTQTIMYGVMSFLAASVLALYVYFFQQLEDKPNDSVETLFLQHNSGSAISGSSSEQSDTSENAVVQNGKSIWERIEDAVLERIHSK